MCLISDRVKSSSRRVEGQRRVKERRAKKELETAK